MQIKEKSSIIREIKSLLLTLEKNNINYLILRNYDFLAGDEKDFDDLDILIQDNQFSQVKRLLFLNKFRKRNEVFYKYTSHDRFLRIHPRSERNFAEYLIFPNTKILFSNRKKQGFFYRLSDEDYLISLISHAILGKHQVQEKYLEEYKNLINKNLNKKYIFSVLSYAFGRDSASQILTKIKQNKVQEIPLKKYYSNFLLKNPRIFYKILKVNSKRKSSRYLRLFKGSLVCFVGPDGSGKTTLLQETNKAVKQPTTLKKEVIHFGSPIKSRFYRSFDLPLKILRTYLNIISGKVTFTDRYIYLTFRRKPFLNRIVRLLAPTPSAVFLAKAPPEIVRKRRQELTIDQIKTLYELYEKIPGINQIDTTLPLQKSKDLVLKKFPLEYK
tara:strand:- start:6404 stop:7558 length:1155 start_codon:yes stop_codon:yes gene_type:complete